MCDDLGHTPGLLVGIEAFLGFASEVNNQPICAEAEGQKRQHVIELHVAQSRTTEVYTEVTVNKPLDGILLLQNYNLNSTHDI